MYYKELRNIFKSVIVEGPQEVPVLLFANLRRFLAYKSSLTVTRPRLNVFCLFFLLFSENCSPIFYVTLIVIVSHLLYASYFCVLDLQCAHPLFCEMESAIGRDEFITVPLKGNTTKAVPTWHAPVIKNFDDERRTCIPTYLFHGSFSQRNQRWLKFF